MVWIVLSLLDRPDVHDVAQGTRARRGPGRHLRHRRGRGRCDDRPDQPSTPRRSTGSCMSVPETRHTFQITFPDNGFGGLVLKPWGERKRTVFQILPEVQQKLSAHPGHPDVPGHAAGAARRRPVPGGVRHRLHGRAGADPGVRPAVAAEGGARAACSPSRRSSTSRSTSRKSELVIDRDKVAALGLNMAAVGADLGDAGGRQLREPVQPRRPQLQGHPADQARRAPQPRPARRTSTSPGRTASWCR